MFVAVWLLRASLLCNPQAFQWKHFYRHRQWQRGTETARLFDFVLFFRALFFHCKLSVFILPVLSGLIFIGARNVDTEREALPSSSAPSSSDGEMVLDMPCVLWRTISAPPLSWCTLPLFVLLWTWRCSSLGRLPQPRVQYVQ